MVSFIIIMSQIVILIFGGLIIDARLKKKYINDAVINKIKNNISELLQEMNTVTERNTELINDASARLNNLVAEKEKQVNDILLSTEKKIRVLDEKMRQLKQLSGELHINTDNSIPIIVREQKPPAPAPTYSSQAIAAKAREKIEENRRNEAEEKNSRRELEEALAKMPLNERVKYLSATGKSYGEIKSLTDLSYGEIETILNM